VDALGNPTHVHLTAGNVHDVVEAPKLIATAPDGANLIGDKGYDANHVVEAAEAKGMTVLIPPRSNRVVKRPIDSHVYKERHLVEFFFNRLKQYRRIATRFEKTAANFLGFVLVASVRMWLA
jgi:putative transposase